MRVSVKVLEVFLNPTQHTVYVKGEEKNYCLFVTEVSTRLSLASSTAPGFHRDKEAWSIPYATVPNS